MSQKFTAFKPNIQQTFIFGFSRRDHFPNDSKKLMMVSMEAGLARNQPWV